MWIKIEFVDGLEEAIKGSLPSRGVWIEMSHGYAEDLTIESLPSRGVWIEIIF